VTQLFGLLLCVESIDTRVIGILDVKHVLFNIDLALRLRKIVYHEQDADGGLIFHIVINFSSKSLYARIEKSLIEHMKKEDQGGN
jgi:hypothetical protein